MKKSECKLQADTVCGATVAASDDRVELYLTKGLDTSNATVGALSVAAKDTCEVLRLDVAAKVAGPTIITGGGVDGSEAVLVARQSSSATVVVAAEAEMIIASSTADIQGRQIRQPVVDGWARNARMVEGIFQIMENMEPPYITLNVLEVAAVRFPDVDRETLRLTIMTVMMSQHRCVVRFTRAGLRLGPRTDREGNAYIELDLDFADRYSTSHQLVQERLRDFDCVPRL